MLCFIWKLIVQRHPQHAPFTAKSEMHFRYLSQSLTLDFTNGILPNFIKKRSSLQIKLSKLCCAFLCICDYNTNPVSCSNTICILQCICLQKFKKEENLVWPFADLRFEGFVHFCFRWICLHLLNKWLNKKNYIIHRFEYFPS